MSREAILDQLLDKHEEQLLRTLENLENRIVALITSAVDDEAILSTQIAIELRTNIRQLIQDTYVTQVDAFVRDYDEIVKEFLDEFGRLNVPDEFKFLTRVDRNVITQLKYQAFVGFEDVANEYFEKISSIAYQNAIAGRPFEELVQDLKGAITGTLDRGGRTFRGSARQIVHDSLMQFDGQFTIYKAREAGIEKFQYAGTLVKESRPHCVEHLDRIYDEGEIRRIWKRNWEGKAEGDPFIVRGGYNCRHHWLPIVDE